MTGDMGLILICDFILVQLGQNLAQDRAAMCSVIMWLKFTLQLLCVFLSQSLGDPSNYHEFCRLLARLKSNYQLGELVKVDNYPEVIKLIAEFTITSLQVRGLNFTALGGWGGPFGCGWGGAFGDCWGGW